MKIIKDEIKRILVIKFGGMGDVLLSTPVLPNLRDFFPDARIDFLTLLKNRDILMDNIYIDRILTFDAEIDKSVDLLRHIRNKEYNLVFDLFCNPRTALVTYLTGAKYRVGFIFRARSYAYNIKKRGRGGEVHNTEFNLDALRNAGIPIVSKKLNLSVNVVHKEFADKFIKDKSLQNEFLVGLTMTGGWESKKYKLKDFEQIVSMLLKKYRIKFLVLWGNKTEFEEGTHMNNLFPEDVVLIPEAKIRYLAAVIQRCKVIIGNDTGPLHIASALDVPALGIYGPTNPKLQGPFGEEHVTAQHPKLDCLHCDLTECPIGNICMTELPKELIVKRFDELIAKNKINIPIWEA